MIREYRGKRLDNNQWVYGNYIYNIDPTKAEDVVREAFIRTPLGYLADTHAVHPKSVGQFTGEKDKNGNKIYEDDVICRTVNVPALGEEVTKTIEIVKYGTAGFDTIEVETGNSNYLKHYMFHSIKVIGNIHDNPEWVEKLPAQQQTTKP